MSNVDALYDRLTKTDTTKEPIITEFDPLSLLDAETQKRVIAYGLVTERIKADTEFVRAMGQAGVDLEQFDWNHDLEFDVLIGAADAMTEPEPAPQPPMETLGFYPLGRYV